MMPATEKEFIRDYIERTKLNYERLKAGPYEVTQLINSAIGLLIIPEQKLYDKITNKMISKQLLNELIVHIQINTYDKQPNLKIIARHLRNSVAHARLELKAQEQPEFDKPLLIESVIFRDEDATHLIIGKWLSIENIKHSTVFVYSITSYRVEW